MAIEFACTTCRQTVRVGDAAAGKKGKCPHCATILQIPQAAGTANPPAPQTPAAKISFPCPGCGKSMAAPAALAGKRGKCPQCQTVFVVGGGPAVTSQPAAALDGLQPLSEGDLSPLSSLGGGDLFADLPPAPTLAPAPLTSLVNPLGVSPSAWSAPLPGPAGGPYAPNPYASPSPYASGGVYGAPIASGYAPGPPVKLMIPAIGLIGIAILSLGWIALSTLNALLTPMPDQFAAQGNAPEAEAARMGYMIGYVVAVAGLPLVGGPLNIGVIFGAIQMLRMKGWGTAKAGAMAAIVPCSLCCLNMPLGIWALVVLNQPDVRRQFR
jgi:hypothetical protein